MSLTLAIVVGIAMGIVFGFALEKSRVFEPGIIVGQMQMRNFIMLKVFLTAVATGAVVLAVLNGFGYVKLQPKAALYAADIVGGLHSRRRHHAGRRLPGHHAGASRRRLSRCAVHAARRSVRRGRFFLCAACTGQDLPRPGRRQAHLHRSGRRSLLGGRAGAGCGDCCNTAGAGGTDALARRNGQ